jgi:hypothetical protein
MINQISLRLALLALAEQEKSNYIMISALMAEVSALRETVRGLDPTFADVLQQKRQEAARANASIEASVLSVFDETIRKLRDGEVC